METKKKSQIDYAISVELEQWVLRKVQRHFR